MAENVLNLEEIAHLFGTVKISTFSYGTDILEIIQTLLDKTQYDDSGFFIVDLSTVISQYSKWVQHLPRVHPHYAIKSNPNPVLIRILSMLGAGFDCASQREIVQVLDICQDPRRVIFANPAKSDSHLRYARRVDVDLMTFDNVYELRKIAHVHPDAQLIMRIKVDDSHSTCQFNSKFGASLDEVEHLLRVALIQELKVVGISFHVGSGCRSVQAFDTAIADARKAFDIAQAMNIEFTTLDLGGGFPGVDSETITFSAIADQVNGSLETYFPTEMYPNLRVIAEPGRFFCAKSHTLVLNVIAKNKKIIDNTIHLSYTVNDGIYGSMNCLMFDHAEIEIRPFNERSGEKYQAIVYGPTCDSMDTITKKAMLPDLAIGECVYIENIGAYTTAAASQFNGFRLTPCEYIMINRE